MKNLCKSPKIITLVILLGLLAVPAANHSGATTRRSEQNAESSNESIFGLVGTTDSQGAPLPLCSAQAPEGTSCLIDDFTTGSYTRSLINELEIEQQDGARIVGGVRKTAFEVGPNNLFDQPTLLDIRPNGPMIISASYKSPWAVRFFYGVDLSGQFVPMNLNLAGYDKIRVNFDAADLVINMVVQVWTGNNLAGLSKNVIPAGSANPFYEDFRFDEFSEGVPGPIDWQHIDIVWVLFQAGTATSANDFAVTSIVATNEP